MFERTKTVPPVFGRCGVLPREKSQCKLLILDQRGTNNKRIFLARDLRQFSRCWKLGTGTKNRAGNLKPTFNRRLIDASPSFELLPIYRRAQSRRSACG
jgi:hypothetical protein